jgi:hypothetical protein
VTYDQFGEPQDDQGESPEEQSEAWLAEHKQSCPGLLDRDGDQPRPCLICRPHLAPGRRVRLGLQ